ncbi:MAG TPA: hypothetical protein VNC78_12070 [Actinomycetota bacterium]|nr:hypothetical protein [Actinomycetota bacterium]
MKSSRVSTSVLAAVALLSTVVVAPALVRSAWGTEKCRPAPLSKLAFKKPVWIDQHASGGEPVSVIADDGSIIVGAHLGTTLAYLRTIPEADFITGYRNQTLVWRSTDHGKTWKKIEILPGLAAHSATSTGFSDPDFAKDSAGNLYGTEIDLANVSVFASHDNGQTWPDANPIADTGDRPWLAARGEDEVYLRITGNLQKSLDGGLTWTRLTDPNAYGKIFIDPTDPKGMYAGSSAGVGVEVSRDDGMSWDTYALEGASNNSVMNSIGVDIDGFVYYGFVDGADDNAQVKFASFDPAAKRWSEPVTIPRIGTGTPFWAWTIAGEDGRAGVGWYEAKAVPEVANTYEVRIYVAATTNARGCGTPNFSVADAARRPIHIGQGPCNGTGCNTLGDRRLGDFFTINYDAKGRLFVTTGDTTLKGPGGLEYQVSRPLFIGAKDSSPRMN